MLKDILNDSPLLKTRSNLMIKKTSNLNKIFYYLNVETTYDCKKISEQIIIMILCKS